MINEKKTRARGQPLRSVAHRHPHSPDLHRRLHLTNCLKEPARPRAKSARHLPLAMSAASPVASCPKTWFGKHLLSKPTLHGRAMEGPAMCTKDVEPRRHPKLSVKSRAKFRKRLPGDLRASRGAPQELLLVPRDPKPHLKITKVLQYLRVWNQDASKIHAKASRRISLSKARHHLHILVSARPDGRLPASPWRTTDGHLPRRSGPRCLTAR